jgi:hypothetical protein
VILKKHKQFDKGIEYAYVGDDRMLYYRVGAALLRTGYFLFSLCLSS